VLFAFHDAVPGFSISLVGAGYCCCWFTFILGLSIKEIFRFLFVLGYCLWV